LTCDPAERANPASIALIAAPREVIVFVKKVLRDREDAAVAVQIQTVFTVGVRLLVVELTLALHPATVMTGFTAASRASASASAGSGVGLPFEGIHVSHILPVGHTDC